MDYCHTQWPQKSPTDPLLGLYWKVRDSLSPSIMIFSCITSALLFLTLCRRRHYRVHKGHQGIVWCTMRTKMSVWWPGISTQVEEFVQKCPICARNREPRREQLIPSPLPDNPWQVIGSDLFQVKNDHYLLTADYFSRYPEVNKLTSTTSAAVISTLKTHFAKFGILY